MRRSKSTKSGLANGNAMKVCVAALLLASASANSQESPASEFVTLGTVGGPVANAERAQPANALVVGKDVYLVDAGDGAVQQLAAAGIPLIRVRGVFLSHLHFDHTGGLLAVLGLRTQLGLPGTLTVYGPQGTRELVDGLLVGMRPAMEAAFGIPGQTWTPRIEVRELTDQSTVELGEFIARSATNSHYSFVPESPEYEHFESLSYRFDLPDRSIVYTGDTGPSANVVKLAEKADLLVSEIINVEAVMESIRIARPDLGPVELQDAERHLANHHLRPCDVGELASEAEVGAVVVTHIVPASLDNDVIATFGEGVRACFDGDVFVARDLDRF